MGIEINNYYQKTNEEIAIALGYFDSVHLGHCRLIEECINSKYKSAVFTFINNPNKELNGNGEQIYTFDERAYILKLLGVEYIITTEFDAKFCSMHGVEFIDKLINNHNVRKIVIGADFRYGVHAECGVNDLRKQCLDRNIELKVVDTVVVSGNKVASREIKKLLKQGEIDIVNALLPYKFFLLGTVQKGRSVGGSILTYPTANVSYPIDKVKIKSGVYHTQITVGSAIYNAITNVGLHPTFEDYNYNVESFILDFEGNLYGIQIKIQFLKYIREVKKFDSVNALKSQITDDISKLKFN